MARSEEGEFELILGNRQLLSVFFIVVILFGVFFTMGYIVGRNSTPLGPDVATASKDSKPVVVDTAGRTPDRTPPAPSAADAETSNREPISTAAQQSAETATNAPQTKPVVTKSDSPPPEKAAPPPAPGSEPATGQTYLQLAATSKREADIMVDVLRQKNFKAMAAEVPEKQGVFRVLVGPITDATANKTRADLTGAGFPGNAAIRRTF